MIRIKRVYEPPSRSDGKRILIDRLWPRGLKKEGARIDDWIRDLAPGTELRKWFGHDPGKWEAFRRRYFRELDGKTDAIEKMLYLARAGTVTLLFASREERFNNAVVLKEYLEARLHAGKRQAA